MCLWKYGRGKYARRLIEMLTKLVISCIRGRSFVMMCCNIRVSADKYLDFRLKNMSLARKEI